MVVNGEKGREGQRGYCLTFDFHSQILYAAARIIGILRGR